MTAPGKTQPTCRACRSAEPCGCPDAIWQGVAPASAVVRDLARVKAIFQQRAILAAMGLNPDAIPTHRPARPAADRCAGQDGTAHSAAPVLNGGA